MQKVEQKSCEINEKVHSPSLPKKTPNLKPNQSNKKKTNNLQTNKPPKPKQHQLKLFSWNLWHSNTSCHSESLASKICDSGFAALTVFQNRCF